jgi:hypothetical protein
LATIIGLAICIGFGLAFVIANVRSWELEDANAYWNAAMRLRHGGPLYIPVNPAADEMTAYRYAPWLAWLWVPLTYLPKNVVDLGWSVILIAAVIAALMPVLRHPSPAAIAVAALMGGLLVKTASTGNVHALLIAALVWGIPRRSGPVWIGLAASVKVAPIAYTLVYLGRRQWGRAAVAVGVAAVLWAPALLYDLSGYPTEAGASLSLLSFAGPILFGLGVALAAVAALRLANTRYAWLGASTTVVAALPRLDYYDLTYLLVAINAAPGTGDGSPAVAR